MVCPSATSKAEARWLRFGLVVVATTSRRDDKDQMIRPLGFTFYFVVLLLVVVVLVVVVVVVVRIDVSQIKAF
jgi:hypothetical protein